MENLIANIISFEIIFTVLVYSSKIETFILSFWVNQIFF